MPRTTQPDRRIFPLSSLDRVLEKVWALAAQVRETAERVHEQAEESRRLTNGARRYSERGRVLSQTGRHEAGAVRGSIGESFNTVQRAERRLSGKRKAEGKGPASRPIPLLCLVDIASPFAVVLDG